MFTRSKSIEEKKIYKTILGVRIKISGYYYVFHLSIFQRISMLIYFLIIYFTFYASRQLKIDSDQRTFFAFDQSQYRQMYATIPDFQ